MNNIRTELDLNNQKYNEKSFDEKFLLLANTLLNKTYLFINKKKHRLSEIEFYLKSEQHSDPFTHCDKDQKTFCKWYFHRQNGKNYKSGTYKGLDITFGSNNSYGGILIRSIIDENNEIIEGPCKVVDHILKLCKKESIEEFVNSEKGENGENDENDEHTILNASDENSKLYLKLSDNDLKNKVYKSPRVGLTLKRTTDKYQSYIMKNYRFLTNANKIKKYIHCVIVNMIKDKMEPEEIKKVTGVNLKTIEKYKTVYDNGKTHKVDEFFKKNLNVNDLLILKKLKD